MPSIQNLMQIIEKQYSADDVQRIHQAYDFADKAHAGQKRVSGCSYIEHPLGVAIILGSLKVDVATVMAGLLHDVPDDTAYNVASINKEFGADVAMLVDGVGKLGKIKYRGIERYVENLRKMFVSIAADLRIALIKFADRINNLETLDVLETNKQYRIAMETLEIYAPLAGRLGINEFKEKLEDLSFKYINPSEYAAAAEVINKERPAKEKILDRAKTILKRELKNCSVINIYGRAKNVYGFYQKMLRHNRDIDSIYDIIALRIIVLNISDCYIALGLIHQSWKPLRGRIKDYIAQPKPNGYRSLHTTIFGPDGNIIEIQIRTQEMDEEAKYGILAHWYYKDSQINKKKYFQKHFAWVDEIVKRQSDFPNKQEYIESLKIDVFQDHIFVFTPTGDVIDLPKDATAIDFAYKIHSDLGNKCVSVIINNHIASLDVKLRSYDVVKIITDKNRPGPNSHWLTFVKTKVAKDHIKLSITSKKNSNEIFAPMR